MRAVLCFATLAVAACGSDSDTQHPPSVRDLPAQQASVPPRFSEKESVLAGLHFYDWESGHTLIAFGLSRDVCVRTDDRTVLTQPSSESPPGYIEVVGRISEPGNYGHMGACAHLFEVSRVVDDRPLSATEREALQPLLRTLTHVPNSEGLTGAAVDPVLNVD
jgi:hypothetical protein